MTRTKTYNKVNVNDNEIDEINKLWASVKSQLIIKKGKSDPLKLKDREEQSLVNLSKEYKNNIKTVSNNKKDVIKFLRINNSSTSIYEMPFEFL
jgi:hypothetical protein